MWAVDKKVKEEGQKVRYRRAMLSQNLERMLLSARFLMGYSIPEDLSSIRVPCAVMTASSDKLHGMEKILDIVQRIPGAEMIEVPSNQYAHEADVLKEIREFQSSVSGSRPTMSDSLMKDTVDGKARTCVNSRRHSRLRGLCVSFPK